MKALRAAAAVLALAAAAGCLAADPYRRLARELTDPLGKTPRRIAVLPFRGLDPRLNAEGEAISERLVSHLYGRGGVELVERSRLQQLMTELSLGQTGALDAKSVSELGRLSGAQALVVGTVARGRRGLELSARVVDVASGRLLAAASARLPEGRNGGAAPQAPLAPTPGPPPARASAERGWRAGADLGEGSRAPWPINVNGVVASGGRIYVVGGATDRVRGAGRGDDAVYSAAVKRDGSLGRWRAEEPLPEGRYQLGSVVWQGRVYAVGGYHGGPRDEVFSSAAGADGALGPWTVAGTLPTGCANPGTLAHDGFLYVAGCAAASGYVDRVFSARFVSDGALGPWREARAPAFTASCSLATDDRRLILAGGSNREGGFSPDIFAAPLSGLDGGAPFVRIGSFPVGLISIPLAVVDGRLWAAGGAFLPGVTSGPQRPRGVLESAALAGDGALGTWRPEAARLERPVSNLYAPLVGRTFYFVGGESAAGRNDSVQRLALP